MMLGNTVVASERPEIEQSHFVIDLDGDRKGEFVRIAVFRTSDGWYDRCVIEVGQAMIAVRGEGFQPEYVIVDVDTADHYREIRIVEQGHGGTYGIRLFRYNGANVKQIGVFPMAAAALGDGTVEAKCQGKVLSTWFYTCRYEMDSSGVFVEVQQKTIELNIPVVLKRELTIHSEPNGSAATSVLEPGKSATIVATDNKEWCLIEAESGVRGWFVVDVNRIEGVHSAEVFDGLDFAG